MRRLTMAGLALAVLAGWSAAQMHGAARWMAAAGGLLALLGIWAEHLSHPSRYRPPPREAAPEIADPDDAC